MKQLKLTRLGMELLDDDGFCPLCETAWEPSKLREHLESRLELYQDARDDLDQMEELSDEHLRCVNRLKTSLEQLDKACIEWGLKDEQHVIGKWSEELDKLADSLKDLETYPLDGFTQDKMVNLLASDSIFSLLDGLESRISELSPEITPEQLAWDQLTRLEENLKLYQLTTEDYNRSSDAYNKSIVLVDAFLNAREKILNQLYAEIRDRFVELYRELHGIDESDFEASLISSGAGIDLKVDFHGRGEHPPHALHSEGHQDSMGICLYLALAERLTQGYIDLIVLDDVMMSVDAPHRRKICHLLAGFFKGKQFLITTHDQTWAKQLQYEGVVTSKNKVELSNWTLEEGPMANCLVDMWELINDDLKKNEVPSAAARLRRGFEEYFTLICSSLQASVKFKPTGQHELGDLLNGGISAYNKLLKKAKYSARSWEKFEELERLEEIEIYSKDVFRRNNVEKWAVNPAVHFNKWAEFTPQDFKPVVDSFYDLYTLFQCNTCGTVIHLTLIDNEPEIVKCNCGNYLWNLKGK